MKISYNWLKEFIDLSLSPKETAEKLTLIGLEVEEIEEYGTSLEGVMVGEVLEVRPHPNADRLQVCDVDLGDSKTQIVCGAKNVAAGQKVPVATVGTVLPVKLDDGSKLKIKKAKLRGEVSEGMICAEDELGLGSDHSGIMVLDESLKTGTPINEIFDVYQDYVIDIAITPNRPDATCHLGVARDLAAALDLELETSRYNIHRNTSLEEGNTDFPSDKKILQPQADGLTDDIKISIKNTDKCHRYAGIVVKAIEVKESPVWLSNRLKAIGLRPVNNVVDVTNYVMYELGQPLHAFDLNLIRGKEITVRDFEKPVEFETLDHIKRTCSPGTLFICDGEGPVAIAGVMGGLNSEVNGSTKNILIESAYFEPASIRKTAKEQGLQTDASYRYERGIDPDIQAKAAQRAAELITQIAGGEQSTMVDVHPVITEPKILTLRLSYLNRLLGTGFSTDETLAILKGLELNVLEQNKNSITFQIPTFRPDLEREVDLVEEVGRLYDYNRIPSPTHGIQVSSEPINSWEKLNKNIREAAQQLGLREIYSNSLISEKEAANFAKEDEVIPTLNPLTKDMTTLRPSLLHGFLKAASYNFNRRASAVRFFELGHVFNASSNGTFFPGIKEEVHVLFGLGGLKHTEHWATEVENYTFFDLKAVVHQFLVKLNLLDSIKTQPENETTLHYFSNDRKIGSLFYIHEELKKEYEIGQPVFAAEFSVSAIHEIVSDLPEKKVKPIPRYPSFEFDLALVAGEDITAGELMQEIQDRAGNQLESIDIFDVFEGENIGAGQKSIAFRLNFTDPNKTLNIKEVEPIIKQIVKHLEKKYSARLRA